MEATKSAAKLAPRTWHAYRHYAMLGVYFLQAHCLTKRNLAARAWSEA